MRGVTRKWATPAEGTVRARVRSSTHTRGRHHHHHHHKRVPGAGRPAGGGTLATSPRATERHAPSTQLQQCQLGVDTSAPGTRGLASGPWLVAHCRSPRLLAPQTEVVPQHKAWRPSCDGTRPSTQVSRTHAHTHTRAAAHIHHTNGHLRLHPPTIKACRAGLQLS